MTTIADLNDKWASYAGPGGWNGSTISLLNFVPSDTDAYSKNSAKVSIELSFFLIDVWFVDYFW